MCSPRPGSRTHCNPFIRLQQGAFPVVRFLIGVHCDRFGPPAAARATRSGDDSKRYRAVWALQAPARSCPPFLGITATAAARCRYQIACINCARAFPFLDRQGRARFLPDPGSGPRTLQFCLSCPVSGGEREGAAQHLFLSDPDHILPSLASVWSDFVFN